MKKKLPRIERTKIYVPHGKGEVAFAWPSQGPHKYQIVGQGILNRKLVIPTAEQTASLTHAVYCNPETENEPEFKEIRDIMQDKQLWIFNKNLWTSKGVYVVPDLNAVGTSQKLNRNKLEKMLKGGKELGWGGIRFSRDDKVRFAPKGSYELGEHTPESLAKDGFVIVSYNLIGAEKLGEVSSKFRDNPETDGLDIQKERNSEQTISALRDYIYQNLKVDGNFNKISEGYIYGHAFGVLK